MPRTDNDSWAITESVGATALGVAAARAAETESDNPLINDPFARIFVDAAGDGIWSMYTNRTLLAGATDLDPDLRAPIQQMIDFMAARTAFFDEYFLATADAGVRQVVILASGLDSRAWRLPWPDGTVVYELDQPKVLEFKSATLRQHGAQPASQLVNVPIDLRQDWPKALQKAGFDPSKPCAWLAEGLVRYLPARAQDLLFERIDALSRPGSWLASNVPAPVFSTLSECDASVRTCGGCGPRQPSWSKLRYQMSMTSGMQSSAPRSPSGCVNVAGTCRRQRCPSCWLGMAAASLTVAKTQSRQTFSYPRSGPRADGDRGLFCEHGRHVVLDHRYRVNRSEVLALFVLSELRPPGAVGPAQLVPYLADFGQ